MKKYYDNEGNIVGVSYGQVTDNSVSIGTLGLFNRIVTLLRDIPKKAGYKVFLKDATDESFVDFHYSYEKIPVSELSDEELKAMFEQELKDSMTVDTKPADKVGFRTVPILTGTTISWTFEKLPDEPTEDQPSASGDDYLDPITYVEGMEVVLGKWYTDGEDTWEAIASGVPTSFADTAFFDIIQ